VAVLQRKRNRSTRRLPRWPRSPFSQCLKRLPCRVVASRVPPRYSDQREKMMPFIGKYVQATGAVFERKGARAIAITQIKELKSVHLDTDAE
jgi:hypothetical protein